MRRLVLALCLTLAACGNDGDAAAPPASETTATPSPSSSPSPSPSPSPTFDLCAEASRVGDVVRSVRKGTETDEEQIATIDELQESVAGFAETLSDPDETKAVRRLADALGRLKVSIDAAGPNYSFDRVVTLNARTVSYLGLTASLTLECTPT